MNNRHIIISVYRRTPTHHSHLILFIFINFILILQEAHHSSRAMAIIAKSQFANRLNLFQTAQGKVVGETETMSERQYVSNNHVS